MKIKMCKGAEAFQSGQSWFLGVPKNNDVLETDNSQSSEN